MLRFSALERPLKTFDPELDDIVSLAEDIVGSKR
jgi:hypothetical protein